MSLACKILPSTNSEAQMAGSEVRTLVLTVAIITLLAVGLYMVDPTMCGLVRSVDGFTSPATLSAKTGGMDATVSMATPGDKQLADMIKQVQSTMMTGAGVAPPPAPVTAGAAAGAGAGAGASPASETKKQEGFANLEDITGPADFGATPSANGCYPRDQLTPGELLPKDGNSTWAQQNPMGTGSLKGKNFLSAGALVGVNTVGQSLRNANHQLRSEPPNPQVPVSVFFNSTIEPDTNRRDMDIN